jgi:endonuclease/exonuclease/phosphatase family metal-dependent hydrolase
MKRSVYISFLLILILACLPGCDSYTTSVRVMSFNLWHDGTQIENGREKIIDEILNAEADIVCLQEADAITAVLAAELGWNYWLGNKGDRSVGIITHFPIKKVFEADKDLGGGIGAVVSINGEDIVVWSAHLDYTHYAEYDVRGYNGITWEAYPNEEPMTDLDVLRQIDDDSVRDEQFQIIHDQLKSYMDMGYPVIIAGDFNCASPLDWTETTKDMFQHNGVVIEWRVTKMAGEAGFIDSYREIHPDPVTHPALSWTSHPDHNWLPLHIDERDRIDFIYYYPGNAPLTAVEAYTVGPDESFTGKGENFLDPYIGAVEYESSADYPSDHNGFLTVFDLNIPLKSKFAKSLEPLVSMRLKKKPKVGSDEITVKIKDIKNLELLGDDPWIALYPENAAADLYCSPDDAPPTLVYLEEGKKIYTMQLAQPLESGTVYEIWLRSAPRDSGCHRTEAFLTFEVE